MACVVTPNGYTAIGKYNTMSITKGAVGLAFLSTPETYEQLDSFLLSGVKISLREALCHQTGLENDETFGKMYDEYMALSKIQNMYPYSKTFFLNEYHEKFQGKHYEYNNIVWRILVQKYEKITGQRISKKIQSLPGLQDAEFDHDLDDYMHGLNGMKLTCSMAKDYGNWARSVLLKNFSTLLDYPPIPKGHWSGDYAGNGVNVHPFFGWFIVATQKAPGVPIMAFSVGYLSQFICVSLLKDDSVTPGIQLRHPYYEDFGGSEVHTFVKDWLHRLLPI